MKFSSGTEEDLHLGLTTGHTCVVTAAGNEIDNMFIKEALARGALPEGTTADSASTAPAFDRELVIGTAIEEMIAEANEGDFIGNGTPNLTKLNARVGFQVSRSEADAIFAEVSKG